MMICLYHTSAISSLDIPDIYVMNFPPQLGLALISSMFLYATTWPALQSHANVYSAPADLSLPIPNILW
jgi:hypothetical protein